MIKSVVKKLLYWYNIIIIINNPYIFYTKLCANSKILSSYLKFASDSCRGVLAVMLSVSSCFQPLISAAGLCAKLDSTFVDPPPVPFGYTDVPTPDDLSKTHCCLQTLTPASPLQDSAFGMVPLKPRYPY